MTMLIIAVLVTVLVSALCSTIEAMLLSSTAGEIEVLKARSPRAGLLLAQCRERLDESISAILTFNTIANTIGAFVCGALAEQLFAQWRYAFAVGMTIGLLIFGEILPKNLGVLHRERLRPILVWVLYGMRLATRPLLWVVRPLLTRFLGKTKIEGDATQEIAFLAVREAQQGNITVQESKLIANALKLDQVHIRDIMTPRIVVSTARKIAHHRRGFSRPAQHPLRPPARLRRQDGQHRRPRAPARPPQGQGRRPGPRHRRRPHALRCLRARDAPPPRPPSSSS